MTDHWQRAYDIRKSFRTEAFLRSQLALRVELAKYGWYEIPEPEEGLGEAIVHVRDLETYIVGYVMNDRVVLDPGEDYVSLSPKDYHSFQAFIAALEYEHNRLVLDWFGISNNV